MGPPSVIKYVLLPKGDYYSFVEHTHELAIYIFCHIKLYGTYSNALNEAHSPPQSGLRKASILDPQNPQSGLPPLDFQPQFSNLYTEQAFRKSLSPSFTSVEATAILG